MWVGAIRDYSDHGFPFLDVHLLMFELGILVLIKSNKTKHFQREATRIYQRGRSVT